MIEVELTQGQVSQIDNDDADLASGNWYASKERHVWYARKNVRKFPRKTVGLHNLVMERVIGRKLVKGEIVDHIDRNGLNNQRENLRVTTPRGNGMNSKIQDNNTSGYRGVTLHKNSGKWQAQLKFKGKNVYCGLHDTPELASQAYYTKLRELGTE